MTSAVVSYSSKAAASHASKSGATHASTSTSSIMTLPSLVRLGVTTLRLSGLPYERLSGWSARLPSAVVVWWPGHFATRSVTGPHRTENGGTTTPNPWGREQNRDGEREGRLGQDRSVLVVGRLHALLPPSGGARTQRCGSHHRGYIRPERVTRSRPR